MRGRLDALPPAFTRGVAPVRTLVPGGARHPHPFHKKCEEWNCKHRKINYLTPSEIRTPPVPALAQGHPPHKCGGQGHVPHPPAHHSTNSSTNSNLPNHRTIPSGSGWERLQTTLVTTWPPALRANSNLSMNEPDKHETDTLFLKRSHHHGRTAEHSYRAPPGCGF